MAISSKNTKSDSIWRIKQTECRVELPFHHYRVWMRYKSFAGFFFCYCLLVCGYHQHSQMYDILAYSHPSSETGTAAAMVMNRQANMTHAKPTFMQTTASHPHTHIIQASIKTPCSHEYKVCFHVCLKDKRIEQRVNGEWGTSWTATGATTFIYCKGYPRLYCLCVQLHAYIQNPNTSLLTFAYMNSSLNKKRNQWLCYKCPGFRPHIHSVLCKRTNTHIVYALAYTFVCSVHMSKCFGIEYLLLQISNTASNFYDTHLPPYPEV